MASKERCQLENKIVCETVSIEQTEIEIVETTVRSKKEFGKKENSIRKSLSNCKETETLSNSEAFQNQMELALKYDEANNGLTDNQNKEETLQRSRQGKDPNDCQVQITELASDKSKEIDNDKQALEQSINEKQLEENKTNTEIYALDIREYEREIEMFFKNNEKHNEINFDATDSKPNLSTKVTDPNLLDAKEHNNDCDQLFHDVNTTYEKPSVICVIEPEYVGEKEIEASRNCSGAESDDESKSSLELKKKLAGDSEVIVKDSDEEWDEDKLIKAYLQPSFLLHRDSLAVFKLKDDAPISLLGKKNEKTLKMTSKFRENLNKNERKFNSVLENNHKNENEATPVANKDSIDATETPCQNIKNRNSTNISDSLNDLSDSNCKFCSPIRPLRKKRRSPSVPVMSVFEQTENLYGFTNHPVAPRRKRRLGKPNNGTTSFDLLMTSKNCSYSLSDIHNMAMEDVEFLSLKNQLDSESESSLPELVLHSAFRKPKTSVPADVTWSTPEITDIVTEGGVITIKNMQHRASICILEASLPSLQHQRNHEPFIPEKTPTAARKRSHTFTSGDRYMREVRDRAKIKKNNSNTVSNLIRRTFSMKSIKASDNPPCMPNLFKRYKQRRKKSKRSKCNNLSTIKEDCSGNNETSVHSFASIFMQDDDYGEDENGQTYLERCTANFEPYLSTSVLFPDFPDMKNSASNLDLSADPPLVYHQFPLKKQCVKRRHSLLQFKPHLKLFSNASAYSLNAEAIKKAHDLLNQKLANKPDVCDDEPIPPERSRSKLSLSTIGCESDFNLKNKNCINMSSFSKVDILKNEKNPNEIGDSIDENKLLEAINEGDLCNHGSENIPPKTTIDNAIEVSQSRKSFSTIFSSSKSFNPVEDITIPVVFEEDKSKVNTTNLEAVDSEGVGATSGDLTNIVDEHKQFERNRIESITNHSKVLKEISEKIHGLQENSKLQHEVLVNNAIRQFSYDIDNLENDKLVKVETKVKAKKDEADSMTSLNCLSSDKSLQNFTDNFFLPKNEPNTLSDYVVSNISKKALDSDMHDTTSVILNENADEHKKFERKRIDSIKHHTEALNEITDKIHGIQEYNRLHHEVLMNNFVRRFSFDFENAGMGNLSNTEAKIDGEMEAKKAISDFLKTLDSPTLLESFDDFDEPILKVEETDPQINCSVEHLEDLHRQPAPCDEKFKDNEEETRKVFSFHYENNIPDCYKNFKVDGKKLAKECTEGTINDKLQNISDMYTRDNLEPTRRLSADIGRCTSPDASSGEILNPYKHLNFHVVNNDLEDEVFINETNARTNNLKLTSDQVKESVSKNMEDHNNQSKENEKLPDVRSYSNSKEETIADTYDEITPSINSMTHFSVKSNENIINEHQEILPSDVGPKEEVLKQIINKNSLLFQTLYTTSISQLQKSNVYHFPYQPHATNVVPQFLYTCDQILALSESNPESPTTSISPLPSPIISIRHSSDEHGTKVVEVESPVSKRKYFVTSVKDEDTPPASPFIRTKDSSPIDVEVAIKKAKDIVEDLQPLECFDSAVVIKNNCETMFPNPNLLPNIDASVNSECNENKSRNVIDQGSKSEELNSVTKVNCKTSNRRESQNLKIKNKNKSVLTVKIPNSTEVATKVEISEERDTTDHSARNLNCENGIICNHQIKKKIENVINEIEQSLEADSQANLTYKNHINGNCDGSDDFEVKSELENDKIKINSKNEGKEMGSQSSKIKIKGSKPEESELLQTDAKNQNQRDTLSFKNSFNLNLNSSIKIRKENFHKKSKRKVTETNTKHEVLFDSIIKPQNYDKFIEGCKTESNKPQYDKDHEEEAINEINDANSFHNDFNIEDGKMETKFDDNVTNENINNLSTKRAEFFFKFINDSSNDNKMDSKYDNKMEKNCYDQSESGYTKQQDSESDSKLEIDSGQRLATDSNDIVQVDFDSLVEADYHDKPKNYLEPNFDIKLNSNFGNELEPNGYDGLESVTTNRLLTDSIPELKIGCNNKSDTDLNNELLLDSTCQLEIECINNVEENNMAELNGASKVETELLYKSEIKCFNMVNYIADPQNLKRGDHWEMDNRKENSKTAACINGNIENTDYISRDVDQLSLVKGTSERESENDSTTEKFVYVKINCVDEDVECYNHIKVCCSIQCNCNTDDEAVKILAVHEKNIPLTSPPVTVRTWEERQVGERNQTGTTRSTVKIPKWVQNGLCLKPEMFQPKDTSLGHPHIEPSREDFERTSRSQKELSIGNKKEEDQIPQQDRCVEVYPETLRQRQRNMAPSPSKVDIKNWENNSGGSDDDSKGGKKFLPSVKALRSQFENGKPTNRDVSPSPPPSISPPIRENLNNLGRTSSNSSTSSLVMSSLEASSGFSSLASSQATSELLSKSTDDEPVEPIFNQFHPVDDDTKDSMCQPPSTIGWNPQPLLKKLYYIPEAPKMHSQGTNYINIDGYLEKLPSGRKKATFWNAWKRRYFVAKDGTLYYYQNNQTEKPNMKLPLMGGKVEIMDQHMVNIDDGEKNPRSASMLGIDDGKGHYVVVRCPTRQEAERWKKALDTHTVDDFSSQYVQPWPRPTNPTLLRDTLIIDIGSCSVRAGVLASQPTLPQLFFPSVVATNRETRNQIWGIDALLPHLRTNSSVAFPIRPSHKISKFSVDLNAISSLLQKTFKDLKVDPKNYNIQLSVPRVLNQITQVELLKILFDKFGVKAVNLTHQSILALYAYNATSGIVVDIGERIDVVPVTDGYIVDGGVSRIPYGGFRILDHIRQFLFQRNLSLVNEVDSYIIRQSLETVCYSAQHYNTEKQRCTINPENFEKTVPLAEFFPNTANYEAFRDISLDFGRFQATEGLFNPDAWGLDHPGLQKLVHKAIQECSMDIRKEMSRSIFLSGGLSQLPGISERLTVELDNLTPPAIHPKVHSSPYRYHAAYIGACVLAESPAFVQSKITKEEWQKQGNSALRKWAL